MVVGKPKGFWLSLLIAAGCAGNVGTSDKEPQTPTDEDASEVVPPGQSPETEACRDLRGQTVAPVAARSRRLSWQEIENALVDLFPDVPPREFSMHTEPAARPARDPQLLEINESFVRSYRPGIGSFAARAAEALKTGGCKSMDADCLQTQLLAVARRAWRGALNEESRRFLQERLAAFMPELGPQGAFAAALELVLASPRFLFVFEPGTLQDDPETDGVFRARGERLVGLWAAALWASVPDLDVLNAAAAGQLDEREGEEELLDRMLSDPRARRGMSLFFRHWLGYNQVVNSIKDAALFPGFGDEVRLEMLRDTETTLLDLMFDENESAAALLRSPLGHPGPKTLALLDWENQGIDANRRDLGSVGRYGVATHPSVLATTSKGHATSIVNRGRFVVERLACGHVPDPPDDIDIDAIAAEIEAAGELSGRELAERHAQDPACGGCHKFMDPFGLVFENFDPVGRHRTEDQGHPIDTRVEVDDALGISGRFEGAPALLEALAQTGRAERCHVTNLAGFLMPTALSQAQACAVTDLFDMGKDQSMQEITRAFMLSDTFLVRTAPTN